MFIYADTSALVKLFAEEQGSSVTRTALKRADALGTGLLTRTELGAALARGVRSGLLSDQEALAARENLAAAWPTWTHIETDEHLVALAYLL
jgi:uncharacterized protein